MGQNGYLLIKPSRYDKLISVKKFFFIVNKSSNINVCLWLNMFAHNGNTQHFFIIFTSFKY